jgi:spoIIIJ-associated protein
MTKKDHQIILKELLEKMGFSSEVEMLENEQGKTINIFTIDSALLIGRGGENLKALQHMANLLFYKEMGEGFEKITIDVNNYRSKQKEFLIELAINALQKVIETGQQEVLRPMTSYERKVVHSELSKNDKIITESIGEDPNRRIVVKIRG